MIEKVRECFDINREKYDEVESWVDSGIKWFSTGHDMIKIPEAAWIA